MDLHPDRTRALDACAARMAWCLRTSPDDDHGGAAHLLNVAGQTARTRPVGRADVDVVERAWSCAR